MKKNGIKIADHEIYDVSQYFCVENIAWMCEWQKCCHDDALAFDTKILSNLYPTTQRRCNSKH